VKSSLIDPVAHSHLDPYFCSVLGRLQIKLLLNESFQANKRKAREMDKHKDVAQKRMHDAYFRFDLTVLNTDWFRANT